MSVVSVVSAPGLGAVHRAQVFVLGGFLHRKSGPVTRKKQNKLLRFQTELEAALGMCGYHDFA